MPDNRAEQHKSFYSPAWVAQENGSFMVLWILNYALLSQMATFC